MLWRFAKWCVCLLLVYVFAPCADARLLLHAGGASALAATVTWLNVKDKGAICDGGSHPLSSVYGSLAAAQAVYPFVTSLTQQIDYAALKATSNAAFGADGSEHGSANPQLNVPVYIPHGICNLGADIWHIANLSGGRIIGDGPLATQIEGSGAAVLQFNGLWYSMLEGFYINQLSSSATAALDVDGNTGHAGATLGVQADSFYNLTVSGGGAQYGVAMCRQGGGFGQCSETTWTNLHVSQGSTTVTCNAITDPSPVADCAALVLINGSNAVDNVFVGGDLQSYSSNGFLVAAGSAKLVGMSFESTTGYTQLANNGCDIIALGGGGNVGIDVVGARTESMCFYDSANNTPRADLHGVNQATFGVNWTASTSFPLNTLTQQLGTDGYVHAYRVTTAGGPTGTPNPPVWPASGTVNDGSIVWTTLFYNVVRFGLGNVDLKSSTFQPSATVVENYSYVPAIVSGCGSTGAVDAGASSWHGSITVGGTGIGSCILQLEQAAGYVGTPPYCAISSPSGATVPGYGIGINTANGFWWRLTLTSPAAGTYAWVCEQ